MSPSSSYTLNCSVCGGEYFSKTEWLCHLTGAGHQRLARGKCLEEWGNKEAKECSLIVFSSVPFSRSCGGGGEDILKYFSNHWSTFVTDFVWWGERALVGIVEFESKNKVIDLVSSIPLLTKSVREVRLGNDQRVHVKLGKELSDLEWGAIFPTAIAVTPEKDASVSTAEDELTTKNGGDPVTTSDSRCKLQEKCNQSPEISPRSDTNNNFETVYSACSNSSQDESISIDTSTGKNRGSRKRPSEAPVLERTPKKSKKELTQSNEDAVLLLKEFVERRGLPPPIYTFTVNKGPKKTFSCCVTVNGMEYKPDDSCPPTRSKTKAKNDIAAFCLKMLTSATEDHCSTSQSDFSKESPTPEEKDHSAKQNQLRCGYEIVPPSSSSTESIDSLQYQYWCLTKPVRIPDNDHKTALKIVHHLKLLFSKHDATVQVTLFRNRYLKLRNPTKDNDELLIFMYNSRSPVEHPKSFTWIRDSIVTQVFASQRIKKFTVIKSLEDSSRFDPNNPQVGWAMSYLLKHDLQVKFRLIFFKRFITEVQMCRLVEYLCKFDSRCHPLMTLVYQWASLNSIRFGAYSPFKKNTHQCLPEPITLQWFVIFFLCHRKIIPTPREIQSRPHKILIERISQVDVGFKADPKFVQEWISSRKSSTSAIAGDKSGDDFTLEVITLFQEFLQFWGDLLPGGNWIVNTRDGEMVDSEIFLSCDPTTPNSDSEMNLPSSSWTTKMTAEEIADLKSLQLQKSNGKKTCLGGTSYARRIPKSYRVNFEDWKVYFINPFISTWNFSSNKNIKGVLQLMHTSGLQLKNHLTMRKCYGVKAASKRFGTLEKVLTIDKVTRLKMGTLFDLSMELEGMS